MTAQWRWITFDCFGTLVDWQAGFASALRPFAGDRTAELLRAYHAHEAVLERLTPHRSYKDVLVTALLRAARDCEVPISIEAARALPDAWASLPVFDDVEPMLAELRQRGWKLAVLTNCDEDLFAATQQRFRWTVRSGSDSGTGARLQAGEVAFPGVRAVDASRTPQLGARGEQLVSRHRAGAGVGHSTRLARSGSDGRDGGPGVGPRAYRSGRAASRQPSGGLENDSVLLMTWAVTGPGHHAV